MHVLKLGKNSEKSHEVRPQIVIEDREPQTSSEPLNKP